MYNQSRENETPDTVVMYDSNLTITIATNARKYTLIFTAYFYKSLKILVSRLSTVPKMYNFGRVRA